MLLPYGVASDGRLVRAAAVPAGLACGCACPACGTPLVARRGAVLAANFAHAASDRACAGTLETVLHRLAKQLIADRAPLTLPGVAAEHAGRRRLVRPPAAVRAETAALEPGLDGLRPDVVAVVAGRPLLVEVAAAHFCGPEKAALIRERRLAAGEIDLSWPARDAPPEALERALLRTAPRRIALLPQVRPEVPEDLILRTPRVSSSGASGTSQCGPPAPAAGIRDTPQAHVAGAAVVPRHGRAHHYRPDVCPKAASIRASASRIAAAKAGWP